jgi:secreted Zn-dependent insulinase-like peptidase
MLYSSRIAVGLLSVFVCFYSVLGHAVIIDKGQVDDREYHYLVLKNKLKVLLISDAEADKAAASLDVHVGSSDDPKDREGLAHFLEHMLFLGTEKYPDAADYQKFIDANAGGHNAYTSAEHTNYFFDIDADKLEPALDRFSQFFIAPLFDEVYVDRERNAVHSEYQAKIKDDSRRGYDVYRQMLNPEHAYAKFSVGSLDTLADRPNDKVRDDLLSFYQQHYSSDQMTLVVLGKESIGQLQKMVEARFSKIPLHSSPREVTAVSLFPSGTLPIEVVNKPVKNIRQMSLTFALPSVEDYYREKPLSFLGSLLGHEGKGSLLSILKLQGWAEALSAGGGNSGPGNSTFSVNINLTEEGIKHREVIRAFIFHALEVIRNEGVEKWRYTEEQQLAKIAFQYREKGRAISAVRGFADQLHEVPADEVISAAYLYKKFDAPLINRLLKEMTPNNVYVSTVYPEAQTDKVTYHYEVPYAVQSLSSDLVDLPTSLKDQYHLPEKNIFVPESSQLFSVDKGLSIPTKIALKNSRSILWVKQDVGFSVPKASIHLRVQSPLAASSLRDAGMNQLLIAMINDSLNENSYPALIAGLSYSLSANSRGFDIRLAGYDDKMSALLDMVIKQVQQPVFSQERFDNVKTNLIRHLGNTQQLTPYRQLFKVLPTTLYTPYYADPALTEVLSGISYPALNLFAKQWLTGANLQGLFYGNINAERVEEWKQSVVSVVPSSDQAVEPARVVKLATKIQKEKPSRLEHRFPVDHNDKAVALYVQGINDTLSDNAKMMLLRQILESSFYSQLRTEQQLGYIVFLSNMSLKDVPGSVFIVQSPTASSAEIKAAVNTFLDRSLASIPDNLTADKKSLATKLLEKPQTLSQKSGRYWSNILKNDDSFSYRERLVDAINAVDAKQLRQYYQQVLLTPSASIWFVAEKNVKPSVLSFPKEQLYYQYP